MIIGGTKLCSRRLPQDIIYCVGGVSVFFPLFTQFCDSVTNGGQYCYTSVINDKLAAEVIELVASVLDGNVSNQQQMYLLSGLSILGFLLQAAPPQLLNMEALPAVKYMFDVVRNSGMSKVLLKDAISQVYLNPEIWLYSNYEVQRDLYIFLIQYFETDGRFLPLLCGLPRIIDIVRQYYWEKIDSKYVVGSKPLLHPVTKQVIGDRPKIEEIRKLRLLLLSLAEMSIKLKVSLADIGALVSFLEKSQDIACIEDILNMIIPALSHGSLLLSFVEHVNALGGCCIFLNLLQREFEPIRLLGLQLLGKLLVGIPSEKKAAKLFTLPTGQYRPTSENLKKEIISAPRLFFYVISERLLKFPPSDNLSAIFFDVLLGGTSPKQVLQEHSQSDSSRDKNCNPSSLAQFFLPQILVCIFKYMQSCQDSSARMRILTNLLGLLYSNPTNIEALMKHGWNSWLETSTNLDVIKDYKSVSKAEPDNVAMSELILVRNLYSLILSYYLRSVKGGWHQLEDTAHFILLKLEQGKLSSSCLLRDILDDIVGSLLQSSLEENIFLSQPGCDNVLHLLKLIQELLVNQIGIKLLFSSPSTIDEPSSDDKWREDIKCTVNEILNAESDGQCRRSLLIVRSHYGQLDDGARFHVLSHLILETIIYGKSMFVTNISGRDDSIEVNSNKEAGFILSFIQKDRHVIE
uniref:Uncharacterized protein n=1 Tax=Avena sativa TaxID=4498 RepID=A0ACD5UJ10_AVESA